jgi:NADH-quinone oxidoreductase subunit L
VLHLLWLVPAAPFAGAVLLLLFGPRWPRKPVAVVGAGSIALSAAIAGAIAATFLTSPPPGNAYTQHLWTWLSTGGFRPEIALYLDPLSVVMILVIAVVALLIHLYSVEFMAGDEGYSRFFAYMNLFVGSMLTLILANNLFLLYLGWEGVGLCSYLLIGFWYRDPENGRAARKAFIVTRVGDTAFTLALLLLFHALGTLDIPQLLARAPGVWPVGSGYAITAAALLLGGAVGKSAQLPLQTWLPDAMAGPTPTSALIHAATMVTAGVYLIARMHALFALAPAVQLAVAVVGAATLLLAGCSAFTQTDIKRVLAYSTMSQIGYMFLALGVGAWPAAIFHFMTHAFFKALLFLSAGIVIHALHNEHDIFRMGGLRHVLSSAFWTFLIGGCSLAGLPIITAGYYSKDWIIAGAAGNEALWIAGLVGALLTSLYTFRLILLVFFGPLRLPQPAKPGLIMTIPAWILAALSIGGGFDRSRFAALLGARPVESALTSALASLAFLVGLLVAWVWWRKAVVARPALTTLGRFWFAGWGFDWLYDRVFVRPVVWAANLDRADAIDSVYRGAARSTASASRALSATETGNLRWYAAAIAAGTVVFLAIAEFL